MDPRTQALYHWLGKAVHVQIDRPIGYLHGDIRYPVNYGFLPGVPGGDGEEQDAYVLGVQESLSSFDGYVIGAIRRTNDCEDKLVVAPAGLTLHQGQIAEAVCFQEQYFEGFVISSFHKSCGVLPYRLTEDAPEYLLVYETYSQCWSIPKGHMEAGETEIDTALRELWEETGLRANLNTRRRASIEYPIRPAGRKQVVFYPGLVTGTPRPRDGEIDGYRWVTADRLKDFLFPDTFEACRSLLAEMD